MNITGRTVRRPVSRRLAGRAATATVVALLAVLLPTGSAAAVTLPPVGVYEPVVPTRLVDTRRPGSGPCVGGGTTRSVAVAGTPAVPANIGSVVVNVTVVAPTVAGYLTVFPAGVPRPTVSTLNFAAGQTVANQAIVELGRSGALDVFVDAGCAHVIVDVLGYHHGGSERRVEPGGFDPEGPTRLLDTRRTTSRVCATSGARAVAVGGVSFPGGSIPATADAAVVNLTVVGATAASSLTAYPTGTATPTATAVSFAVGQVVAAGAVVELSPTGQFDLQVRSGCADVIVDLYGYYDGDAAVPAGGFTGVPPARVLDTRATGGCISSTVPRTVSLAGLGGVSKTAKMVQASVTAITPATGGHLTVFTAGAARPAVSSLNFVTGRSATNAVTVQLDALGRAAISVSEGCVHVLVDVLAWANLPSPVAVTSTFAGFAPPVDGSAGAGRLGRVTDAMVEASGRIVVLDGNAVRAITSAGTISTLAGDPAKFGASSGPGARARFSYPTSVVPDGAGGVFVADSGNHAVRRISADGTVSLFAGNVDAAGTSDGTGGAARFRFPSGMVRLPSGTLVVADQNNHTVRRITAAGAVSTLAGSPGVSGTANGSGGSARFNRPQGVAADAAGNVYVADYGNDAIRRITPAGVVTTLAGLPGTGGSVDGTGSAARFDGPADLVVEPSGNLLVVEEFNAVVRRVTPTGVVTRVAGQFRQYGALDGDGTAARFAGPRGAALDSTGNLVVVDTRNAALRRVSPTGVVTSLVSGLSSGAVNGTGTGARFRQPSAAVRLPSGDLVVADAGNHTLRRVTRAGVVSTFAGLPGVRGHLDGAASTAQFDSPRDVAVGSDGSVYVADSGNFVVRKVSTSGVVTTLAGSPGVAGELDGTGAAARFNFIVGLAVLPSGNVVVTDISDRVRRVTPTGVVTSLAGRVSATDTPGSANGTGTAAKFWRIGDVAAAPDGSMYVADTGNRTIRRVSSTGVVTTVAGTPGILGRADGTGAAAEFSIVSGLGVSPDGTVWIADGGVVRRMTPAGAVTSLIGTIQGPGNDDGTPWHAVFSDVGGSLVADSGSEVFLVDAGTHSVRRVVLTR